MVIAHARVIHVHLSIPITHPLDPEFLQLQVAVKPPCGKIKRERRCALAIPSK